MSKRSLDTKSLVITAGITLGFFVAYYLLGSHFSEVMWLITFIMLGTALSIIMILAGFSVFKSLFYVSAEISLLIFLAQSYCAVPQRTSAGDQALKSLLTLGIIYIIFIFCKSQWKLLKKKYKSIAGQPWPKEMIIAVTIFFIFTVLIIYQIYLVINPIVTSLCVYK